MSAREYASGTVAVATVDGVKNVRVMRVRKAWVYMPSEYPDSVSQPTYTAIYDNANKVVDVRPLVVLDLPDPTGTLATLRDSLGMMFAGQPNANRLIDLIDQIEAQTKPPKPPEPTGLGAVVEVASGNRWVRTGDEWAHPWLSATPDVAALDYSELAVVRVLSEGVKP